MAPKKKGKKEVQCSHCTKALLVLAACASSMGSSAFMHLISSTAVCEAVPTGSQAPETHASKALIQSSISGCWHQLAALSAQHAVLVQQCYA